MNLRLLVLLSLIVTAVTYSQELEKHRLDKIDGLREVTHIAQKGVDLRPDRRNTRPLVSSDSHRSEGC
jgi:hypothetical protein